MATAPGLLLVDFGHKRYCQSFLIRHFFNTLLEDYMVVCHWNCFVIPTYVQRGKKQEQNTYNAYLTFNSCCPKPYSPYPLLRAVEPNKPAPSLHFFVDIRIMGSERNTTLLSSKECVESSVKCQVRLCSLDVKPWMSQHRCWKA